MNIGTGVGLIAAGAILHWALEADLPVVAEDPLGVVLVCVGIMVVAASLITQTISHGTRTEAGTDGGIALFAAGAILYWAVDTDLPFVIDSALAVILMVGGVVALVVTLVMDWQRSRARRVVQHRPRDSHHRDPRYDDPRYDSPGYDQPRYDDPHRRSYE